jgi:hypothetical protein
VSVGGDDVSIPEAGAAIKGVNRREAGGSKCKLNARLGNVNVGPDQGVVRPEGGDC